MAIRINQAIWERFPQLKIGVIIARSVDNTRALDATLDVLRSAEKEAKRIYETLDLSGVDKLSDWRQAYRAFGYKPSKALCSAEALLKRVVKGKELPSISPLVNLCSAISLLYALPSGADDLDRIEGELQLTFARGDEPFRAIGAEVSECPLDGEVVYRDAVEVTSKAWNYRECDKTKITCKTRNALLVTEGLEHTSLAELAGALKHLGALIQTHCGGELDIYLLDAQEGEIGEASRLDNREILTELPKPSYHNQEAYQMRMAKLEQIRELGMDPYPPTFAPTHTAGDLISTCSGHTVGTFEEAELSSEDPLRVAGRLVLFRAMGTNIFAQLLDETEKIQVLFNKEHTTVSGLPQGEVPIKFIEKKFDLGDIIGVEGHLFRTRKGELTLYVKSCTLLCKSLLPLPDKHQGIVDKGVRYRKRWLDLISSEEVSGQLRMRSQIVASIRKYHKEHGFLEVETPILQNIYGGAQAKPFTTHHNALNQDMYCRIALEIALKKLVVGGMNRVYEIGKVFRNEGIDKTHNPEFTMLEGYCAYWDYSDVMAFIENLYATLATEIFGTTVIGKRKDKKGKEHLIDFKTPWIRMTMKDAIRTYGGHDVDSLSDGQMRSILKDHLPEEKLEGTVRGLLIAHLFEVFAEEHLIQPHHITDHPIETTPLCKLHRNFEERKEGIVERFETFILGMECCNAYTELNDPVMQRRLLEEQAGMRDAGDEEASPLDEEFIEAICQGMPPTGGYGIGIDRLCMLLTGVDSIRDVLFFPVMRPEE